MVSLFRNTTTPPRASAAPWLHPRANPWFSSLATTSDPADRSPATLGSRRSSRCPRPRPGPPAPGSAGATAGSARCAPRRSRPESRWWRPDACPWPLAMGVAFDASAIGCTWRIAGTTSQGATELRGVGEGRAIGVSNRRSNRGGRDVVVSMLLTLMDVDQLLDNTVSSRLVDPCRPTPRRAGRSRARGRAPVVCPSRSLGRHRGTSRPSRRHRPRDLQDLVDSMPRVLEAASIGGGWSLSPDAPATTASARQAMEGAADGLMPAHAELARLDPRSPEAVRKRSASSRLQVSMVSERRELVEKRVREVQALLVEQYKRGDADPDDWVRLDAEVAAHFAAGTLRSFPAHPTFDAFDLRSLAARLNRCSAPCG